MSDSPKELLLRIQELEFELSHKEQEVTRYRDELIKTNSRIEKMMSDLSSEIYMAHQIQKVLSPTEIPHIQGIEFSTKFLPGNRNGGDYFDIFELEDRMRFAI